MAFIHQSHCHKCGKPFIAVNNNHICNDCYQIERNKKYKKYMIDIREGKTIEQRVEQIEEWIYNNKDKIGYDNETRFRFK